MTVIGTVTGPGRGQSEVTIYRSGACGGDCGQQCASCKVASPLVVLVDNNGWQPMQGQLVKLRALERNTVGLAAMVYLVPLLTGVGGYIGAEQLLALGRGVSVLVALGALLAGFTPAFFANRKLEGRPTHMVYDILDAHSPEDYSVEPR